VLQIPGEPDGGHAARAKLALYAVAAFEGAFSRSVPSSGTHYLSIRSR
jgi:hypothetical protein